MHRVPFGAILLHNNNDCIVNEIMITIIMVLYLILLRWSHIQRLLQNYVTEIICSIKLKLFSVLKIIYYRALALLPHLKLHSDSVTIFGACV